jgi:hypothetical protein
MASQEQKYESVFCSQELKIMLKITRRFHEEFSRELSTNLSMYKEYKLFCDVGCICKGKSLNK